MEHERKTPQHTALIIPDGRTRIYDRDEELKGTGKGDAIRIPAKDVFLGKVSSLCRTYAERFYPDHWFILSTNNNKGQPMLVHPDQPIKGDYDNPPYPIPPKIRELKYWQPFGNNGKVRPKLVKEAKALGLLPPRKDDAPNYSRIIFLGNHTSDAWWTQQEWDRAVKENRSDPDPRIYSAYKTDRFVYTLYSEVIRSLFANSDSWLEFPLADCATEAEMVSRVSDAVYRKFPLHRSPFALKKISVDNLFRMHNPDFDYPDIPLGSPAGIRILTAPNGYGKSTIFRLIRAVFRGNLKEIASIPFDRAEIILTDDMGQESFLEVVKKRPGILPGERIVIRFTCSDGRIHTSLEIDDRSLQYSNSEWVERKARELGKFIPPVYIRFLSSERLFHDPLSGLYQYDLLADYDEDIFSQANREHWYTVKDSPAAPAKNDEAEPDSLSRIRYDAWSLARRIDGVLTDYATTSHKSDVKFPVDLLKVGVFTPSELPAADNDLRDRFRTLLEKRSQLERTDFLPFRNWWPKENDPFSLPDITGGKTIHYHEFLALYLREQGRKYEVFDWLNSRCQLFGEIINSLFIFTRMRIRRDIGFSFYNLYGPKRQYRDIPLDRISSGEMHQVVMYYDFLFNCDPGTIVLIDEPEISLHVTAQEKLVDNIGRISEINNLQFIVATHSPFVINSRWDITYDLLLGEYA